MKKFVLIFVLFLLIGNVLAIEIYAPNPANKEICQESGGGWMAISYKNSFWGSIGGRSYSIADTYCQCNQNEFVRTTTLSNWEGCNGESLFINEAEFISQLEIASKQANNVTGDINDKYLKIVENNLAQGKLNNLVMIILVLVVIMGILFIIYNKIKKKKLGVSNIKKGNKN